MDKTTEQILQYLAKVKTEMSKGDVAFFESLNKFFERKGSLSFSQEKYLKDLQERYNPEQINKKRNWEEQYSQEHRDIALKCARYYDAQFPRYFGNLVDIVILEPTTHVLSLGQFNKMCNNKYAKKVLNCYSSDPKFSQGDIVQVRANNRIDLANKDLASAIRIKVANEVCMVLEVDSKPITRAAKGSRVYKVLITQSAKPIYAHESDLKKLRRAKKR